MKGDCDAAVEGRQRRGRATSVAVGSGGAYRGQRQGQQPSVGPLGDSQPRRSRRSGAVRRVGGANGDAASATMSGGHYNIVGGEGIKIETFSCTIHFN